jgi:hypothetical protein
MKIPRPRPDRMWSVRSVLSVGTVHPVRLLTLSLLCSFLFFFLLFLVFLFISNIYGNNIPTVNSKVLYAVGLKIEFNIFTLQPSTFIILQKRSLVYILKQTSSLQFTAGIIFPIYIYIRMKFKDIYIYIYIYIILKI